MGRAEKSALRSNLRILLMHLIKYKARAKKPSNSWLFPIIEHRQRINELFKDSPSLKRYFQDILAESYSDSIHLTVAETGLDRLIFSIECPFKS